MTNAGALDPSAASARPGSRLPRGRHLHSFVVVADTHVNESDDTTRSPFASNRQANDRARHVFAEIAAMSPAPSFVVHLGDLVHPCPDVPTFEQAARRFRDLTAALEVPLHLVPGNHDIGEKNQEGVPASIVTPAFVEQYRQLFGTDYYAFEHEGLKGLVVNAFLFNTGWPEEQAQKDWIDAQLAEASQASRRVFVFSHYPPYLLHPGENPMYDTLDEPARSWLLERLRRPNVEAIFTGHVHNFWYDVVGQAEMYLLPSTAFLRHDYTEFYREHPGEEHGRNDRDKLGYMVVDVYERGHVAHLVRTHGRVLRQGQPPRIAAAPLRVHVKTSTLAGLGVEMRHPWAETVQIPATGGLEEVGRKLARNDYQTMALWECGLRTLKVPAQDLLDPQACHRARLLSEVGHDFIVTASGVPVEAVADSIGPQRVQVQAVELVMSLATFERKLAAVQHWRHRAGVPVLLNKLRTHEDDHFDGQHFSHFVKVGFLIEELQAHHDALATWVAEGRLDGYGVRLERGADLLAAAQSLEALARSLRARLVATVKLATASLARRADDDADTARLVADAVLASRICANAGVTFVLDTFMDIDRGYFPRNGLVDRRFNPRPAARVVAALHAALPPGALALRQVDHAAGARCVHFAASGRQMALVSGPADAVQGALARLSARRTLELGAHPAGDAAAPETLAHRLVLVLDEAMR